MIPPSPYNSRRRSISAHFLSIETVTLLLMHSSAIIWPNAIIFHQPIDFSEIAGVPFPLLLTTILGAHVRSCEVPATCAEMSIWIAPATVPSKLTANDRRIQVGKRLGAIPGHRCIGQSVAVLNDSSRDQTYPFCLEVTNNHLKGSLNHPKKVTKNCQV